MAVYKGLRAIAARMGCSEGQIRNMISDDRQFPCYLKRLRGTAIIWTTNDDLIYGWELEQCRKTRESYRKGKRKQDRCTLNNSPERNQFNYAA